MNCSNYLKIVSIVLFFALFSKVYSQETNKNKIPEDSIFTMTKSPWKAVGYSAVIPGAGQFYNESYWKIPIVWGFLGYNISVWIRNNNKYKDYRDLYIKNPDNTIYRSYRDFYKDQRDQFAFWIALTYFLNLVDAYVDAHMFDFDVSPDPVLNVPKLNMNLRINF